MPLCGTRVLAEEGELMAYEGSQNDLVRRTAFYFDRILKGAETRRPIGAAADQV
jgi:hypothetical protein